ncbi:MAG: WecB/TagA/CpsF family glycosyltransferase, partial [Acidobacteriaceae bacterium]|nr:WecB/TagA/CpsF family glycosyltransferase [Acidobacteriaceae bacterium]
MHGSETDQGVTIVGVPLDNMTMQSAIDRIDGYIREGGFHQVATANVNFLVNSLRHPELRKVLGSCDMVVPDGMPLLWISRRMGTPLRERVTGVDMVPHLARLSAAHGYRIYLLGALESSSNAAVTMLERQYPGVQLVGRHCPPYKPLDEMDNEDILRRIRAARPDILLVAFGNPKQEIWLARHRHRLQVPVCIGIGGSLNMIAGIVPRSPEKYQRLGIEWLYRASREPGRLLGRYISDAMGLLLPLARQMLAFARQGERTPLFEGAPIQLPGVTIFPLTGGLSGFDCSALEEQIDRRRVGKTHVILDLSQLNFIDGVAVTRIIRLANRLHQQESGLWLANLRPSVYRILRGSRAGDPVHFVRSVR